MRSVNNVVLMGNLVADPELRETNTGKKVAHMSVATNRKRKNKDGEPTLSTDFHRVIAWQKLGEICGEHLTKGSSVYVEGSINNRSYETKEGEKRYITEIVARNINEQQQAKYCFETNCQV